MAVLRSFVNDEVPSKTLATAKEIAQYALDKAIILSPFVTGRFIASWRINVGDDVSQTYSVSNHSSAAEAAAVAEGESAAAISQIKLGVTFSISNNAPHAPYVEYGSPTTIARYITRRVAQSIGGKFGRI